MKIFIQFSAGLIASTILILGFFGFYLPSVQAKSESDNLYVIERQIVTTHVNADGSDTEIEELTKLIRSELAVEAHSQADIAYNSTFQTVDVLEAYTILPNGKKLVVSPKAIRTLDDDISSGAPQFSDQKHRIIIFPSVVPGSRVYYKVLTKTHTPLFQKNYQNVLYLPPHQEIQYFEWHFSHDPKIHIQVDARKVEGGRGADGSNGDVRYTFRYHLNKTQTLEAAEVSYSDFAPHLIFSSFKTPIEIGKAYENSFQEKSRGTQKVIDLAEKITKGIEDPKEQATAIYQWVSSNIRYVAIYLGNGGVVPNDVDAIIDNRYGDCKDHDLLLRTLLAAKGISSSSALINLGKAYTLPKLGTISPMNHVITYLPKWNLYLDSTLELAPYGLLDFSEMDKPVILTSLGRLGRTPKLTAENNGIATYSEFTVDEKGGIQGKSSTSYLGPKELDARATFYGFRKDYDAKMVRNYLSSYRQTGSGSLEPKNSRDLKQPFQLHTKFSIDPTLNLPGPGAMSIPIGLSPAYLTDLAFNALPEQYHFPYRCNSESIIEKSDIHFPKNIKVIRVPQNIEYLEKGVLYVSQYTLKDNTVSVSRILKLSRPNVVCQPGEIERAKRIHALVRKDTLGQIVYE